MMGQVIVLHGLAGIDPNPIVAATNTRSTHVVLENPIVSYRLQMVVGGIVEIPASNKVGFGAGQLVRICLVAVVFEHH